MVEPTERRFWQRRQLPDLPDCVKGHILTFLPITDAVKTLALRSFGNLWASSVQTLVFDSGDVRFARDPDNLRFTQFVNGVLQRHEKPLIEKFELKFSPFLSTIPANGAEDRCQETAAIVDSWIRFAVEKKVKVLDVGVYGGLNFRYEFPEFATSCDSIEELRLSRVKLGRARETTCIRFENVKTVSLHRVRLGVSVVEAILEGCPNMQKLELMRCLGVKKVECSSEKLKHLAVILHESFSGEAVKISGEHLVSLRLSGKVGWFTIDKVSSLVEASLNLRNRRTRIRQVMGDLENLERLQRVATDLTISGGSLLETISVFSPVNYMCPRQKSLVLKNVNAERHIPAVIWLLKNTTNLENLRICHDGSVDEMLPGRECNFDESIPCLQFHLAKLEVFGSRVSKPMFELIKYIFRRSNVLTEVVISLEWDEGCNWPSRPMPRALWDIYQSLLHLPKAVGRVPISCKW